MKAKYHIYYWILTVTSIILVNKCNVFPLSHNVPPCFQLLSISDKTTIILSGMSFTLKSSSLQEMKCVICVRHTWIYCSATYVDILQCDIHGYTVCDIRGYTAVRHVDVLQCDIRGCTAVRHTWMYCSSTYVDILQCDIHGYTAVQRMWIYYNVTYVDVLQFPL